MRHKKLNLSLFFLLILGLTGLQAQEAIIASGGEASGSGGSISYSVGQMADSTKTSATGIILIEGMQQPYEISIYTSVEEAEGISLALSVYPNPTTDKLTLNVDESDFANAAYQLFDINGQLLEGDNILDNLTYIDMGQYLPGTYFLKVIQKNQILRTFKIIKN